MYNDKFKTPSKDNNYAPQECSAGCGRKVRGYTKHGLCPKCRSRLRQDMQNISRQRFGTYGAFRLPNNRKVKTRCGTINAKKGHWLVFDRYGWPTVKPGTAKAPRGMEPVGTPGALIGYTLIVKTNI
ncbi:hypothetical protein ACQZV8_11345 [Magnetococcales bacterium HHB-1]